MFSTLFSLVITYRWNYIPGVECIFIALSTATIQYILVSFAQVDQVKADPGPIIFQSF